MKKLIFTIGFSILLLVSTPVYAQEATSTPTQQQYVDLLNHLISLLEVKLNMLVSQLQSIQTTQATIVENTTPAPIQEVTQQLPATTTPQIMKNLTISVDNKRGDESNKIYYDVYAYYSEDGNNVIGVPITLSSDDEGTWYNNGQASVQTATQNTHGGVGIIGSTAVGIVMTFEPADEGDRVITATANDVVATTTAWGAK